MAMREVDSYTRPGNELIVLYTDGTRWEVTNWGIDGEEHSWTVGGYNVGGREEHGRIIGGEWHHYTEAEARAEFERWRQ